MPGTWQVLLLQALAGLLVGLTLFVVIRYFKRWRKQETIRGHLPLHIWLVALSYDLLIIAIAIQASVLIRWWHWFLYLPALLLGLPAMMVLSRPPPALRGDHKHEK